MNHFKMPLTLFLALFLIFSCAKPEEKLIPDTEINTWFDAEYEELLQMSPLQLTTQGRKDLYDQIDDMSEAAEDKRLSWMEASVKEMKEKFDSNALSPEAKISFDLWEYQYEMEKRDREFRRKNYVFNQMSGIHTMIPNMLINFHKVDEPSDMEALISRINESGRAINQLLERAKLQTEAGVRPPKFAYEFVIQQSASLIKGQPFTEAKESAPLWTDALSKIEKLEKDGKITVEQAEEFKGNTKEALLTNFKPAYEELIAWLESELPNLEEKPTGVSRHENGAAFYAHKLKTSTTTDLSAEEIHQIGLDEVKRIQ